MVFVELVLAHVPTGNLVLQMGLPNRQDQEFDEVFDIEVQPDVMNLTLLRLGQVVWRRLPDGQNRRGLCPLLALLRASQQWRRRLLLLVFLDQQLPETHSGNRRG
jgi:hypothetical protein